MGTFKVSGDISFTGSITTPGNDTVVIKPALNNYDQIGASDCKFWKVHASTFYGNLSGNADTATKLQTARTISLTGSITGSGTFDGSGNLSIATTTNHSHSYIPLTGGFTSVSSGETDLGIAYGSNKYLYLWGKPGDGSRGLYDTNKGSVITVTNSAVTFYGTASYASYLSPMNSTTTNASSWDGAAESGGRITWSQAFKYSSFSDDTGDIVFKLRKNNGTELCICIDGDYYSMGNKVLHAGNWSSYCAPASHSHSYLPLSGGTMTGPLQVNSTIFGYNYTNSNNAAAFMFDKPSSNYTGIGACGQNDMIHFGPCNASGAWISSYNQIWRFQGGVYATGWLETDNYGSGDPGSGTAGYGRGGAIYFKVIG